MGTFSNTITASHQKFVGKQHMFFVSTAPLSADGHVNLSPKGLDCFRFLSDNKVGYMDLISSGNETSAHVLENGRITLMFCSFEGAPSILRFYGRGETALPGTELWTQYAPQFTIHPSTRQLIIATISLVQTSCGWGVPLFDYVGERDVHFKWATKLGQEGLQDYVEENNLISLDGLPTSLGLSK